MGLSTLKRFPKACFITVLHFFHHRTITSSRSEWLPPPMWSQRVNHGSVDVMRPGEPCVANVQIQMDGTRKSLHYQELSRRSRMILVIFLLSYSFIRFSRLEGKRPRSRNPKCWFGQISEQSKGPLSAALLLAACSISVLTALTILSHTPNKLGIPYVNCRSH